MGFKEAEQAVNEAVEAGISRQIWDLKYNPVGVTAGMKESISRQIWDLKFGIKTFLKFTGLVLAAKYGI